MNFKRFHESKNLFDEDNIVDGGAYYPSVARGRMISSNNTAICLLPCKPNTAYTVSRSTAITKRFAMCFLASNEIYDDMPIVNGIEANTGLIMTSTSTSNSRYLCFYYAKTSGSDSSTQAEINAQFAEIMINEGAEPLPYEPYGDLWHDIPHYIHNTSTDTITTLPAVVYANDTTATVGLKGDMSQTGTPTPSSPIQPQECGERTGNLLNLRATGYYIANNGVETPNNNFNLYDLSVNPGETYTINCDYREQGNTTIRVCGFDSTETYNALIVQQNASTVPITFTIPENTTLIKFSIRSGTTDVIIAAGETAEYVPVGYKIPILNNLQTTNVYLGEVQSTRQIKKLVLDGTENFYASGSWGKTNTAVYYTTLPDAVNLSNNVAYVMCSHYVGVSRNYIYDNDIECSGMTGSNALTFRVSRQYAGTKEDFLAYLAQQYAAGTPVCVWYVLANPTTGVVNEPIRKIGTYADEVSNVSIPTIAGANTLSVDTTLQPSEVTATYKGWHPVADVHERESGAWD